MIVSIRKKIVIRHALSFFTGKLHSALRYLGVRRRDTAPLLEPSAIARQEEWLQDQILRPISSDAKMRRVEVIILAYNAPEMEAEAAAAFIQNTDWPYKLVVFDNRNGTKNMSKIWNKLIRESTCDYVLIMDSDVFVPKMSPCWLTRLMQTFDEHAGCAVVTPKVTRTSSPAQRASHPVDAPAVRLRDEFAGMCVLYRKDVFQDVGYFDEDFLLYGSDSEWAFRALASASEVYVRPDVVVDHVGHYSTKKASAEEIQYNYALEREYAGKLLADKRSSH